MNAQTSQHTHSRGESWSVYISQPSETCVITGHEYVEIARVSHQDTQCDGGRSLVTERRYAHLIAAAPELLACLQRVLAFEQRLTACACDGGAQLVTDIKAAVARAENR